MNRIDVSRPLSPPWTTRLQGALPSRFRVAAGLVLAAQLGGCAAAPDSASSAPDLASSPARTVSQAVTYPTVAFAAGSLVVPMDTTYQDSGMLKAFGLLFALLKANIQVNWGDRQ